MTEFEVDNAGSSEAQQKLGTSFLLAQASTTGLARTGVITGLTVAQTTTASGSVTIAAGAGVVQASVLAGASILVNDTARTLDVFTANPMGALPRNDIIVFDAVTATIAVIVGVAAATPDDPTIPATALPLARLSHNASAPTIPTSAIGDLRVYTGLRGTPIPVAYQSVRDALTAYAGLQVYRLDTHALEMYQNGAWAKMATQVDTGWINPGFTAAPGFTISAGQTVRRLNGIVSVNLFVTTTDAIAAGNISNVAIANIPTGWAPAVSNGHLGGGPTGGGHTAYPSSSGVITMTATDTGFPAGSSFYVLGMWML